MTYEETTCVECGEELREGTAKRNKGLGYCINSKCKLYGEWVELRKED